MTLYEVIKKLEKEALSQPNVRTVKEGSVYEIMNSKEDQKYSCVVLTQGTHKEDENTRTYAFTIFYIDRLVDDMESNRLQIQSIGIDVLSNILETFMEDYYEAEITTATYNVFQQRFLDECAGVYTSIEITLPRDLVCSEEF